MLTIHIDFNCEALSRETISTLLRFAASCGYDSVLWEVEDMVQWETCPECVSKDAFSKEAILSRPMFESNNYLVAEKSVAAKYPPDDPVSILRGECLITNCEDDGPNSMDMLKQMLRRQFGVIPDRFAQTNSTNTQLMMVRARHGVAIVPDIISESMEDGLVRFPMTQGDLTRYEMFRLAGNSNAAADLLMEFDREA